MSAPLPKPMTDERLRLGITDIRGEVCILPHPNSRMPTCAAQKNRVTTFIEVILNQELGEPFRRDAMKKPVVIAGIDRKDMRSQQV